MNLVHKLVSLGAVTAVVLGLFAASAGAVHAQGPFTAYGIGQTEGAVVAAGVGGVICGTTTVNSDGEWLLAVDSDAVCNPSEGDTINFYVDMAGVSYIDSSGVASLVESLQGARKAGCEFVLAAVSEPALRVLHLARLDTVFTIHESREAALAEIG